MRQISINYNTHFKHCYDSAKSIFNWILHILIKDQKVKTSVMKYSFKKSGKMPFKVLFNWNKVVGITSLKRYLTNLLSGSFFTKELLCTLKQCFKDSWEENHVTSWNRWWLNRGCRETRTGRRNHCLWHGLLGRYHCLRHSLAGKGNTDHTQHKWLKKTLTMAWLNWSKKLLSVTSLINTARNFPNGFWAATLREDWAWWRHDKWV